ncbi:MAG: hypothetical protein K0S26_1398 [Bacteroidota bacterium]|nr:hypothetical protein [Bacteroidota bacterium]
MQLKETMHFIELPYVTISYQEPIVYFRFMDGAELGFPEIRELISQAEKLSDFKPYLTFSDVRNDVNVTNEGKRMLENFNNMPLFRGSAVLVKNNLYRFAVDFMNYYNKPKFPFKAFTSEEKAINWLLSLPLNS